MTANYSPIYKEYTWSHDIKDMKILIIKPSRFPMCHVFCPWRAFCGHHKVIQFSFFLSLPIKIQPKALLKQSSQEWGFCQTLSIATFPLFCTNSDSVKAEYLLQSALLQHTLHWKPLWFGWLWPFSILVKSFIKKKSASLFLPNMKNYLVEPDY